MLAEICLIYGDICVRLFDYNEAEKYYGMVMNYSDDEVQSLYIKACLSYGKMYNLRREYEKSLEYLRAGLDRVRNYRRTGVMRGDSGGAFGLLDPSGQQGLRSFLLQQIQEA